MFGFFSDGGFIFLDEYGFSFCDFWSFFCSVILDFLGYILLVCGEEELSNYICMGGKGFFILIVFNGYYILFWGGNGYCCILGIGLGMSLVLVGDEVVSVVDLDNWF